LFVSVATFEQVPGMPPGGHLISPAGHAPHTPLVHDAPTMHCMPQLPQLLASDAVSTHTPSHGVMPAAHAHCPDMHAAPTGHPAPHEPQLFGSVAMSAQPVGQLCVPDPQMHTPVMHVAPCPQTVPHAPQL
jgi:hypothetical protein